MKYRLDLREISHLNAHPKIFDAFEELGSGESLELVTAPPRTNTEHEPVREGRRTGTFDPEGIVHDCGPFAR